MGIVSDETSALFLEVEGVLDEHGLAVAAVAVRLAELIDSPGDAAVAPLVKEWRTAVDLLKAVLDAHREPDAEDAAEVEARRLRAV